MNECFLFIKRISDVNFKFVINSKEKSKVLFKAKLLNNSEIEVFAYDNIADYIYQKDLDRFFLRGKLRENMQVEIIEIYNFMFLAWKTGLTHKKQENVKKTRNKS